MSPPSEPAAEPLALDTPRALARALSRAERGGADADALMRQLGPRPLRAWTIGITGPPGAGKSTLVDRLIGQARAAGLTVGVIAVDPSSPFSGGAILGDRVRMTGHSGDRGVFIRSMAARDSLGGLASATRDAARLLDAYGFDVILLETVGVGQSELDVVKVADSVVVIAVPGLGDAVQTLKAGILEVADLFVVNMADRPGAERTVAELTAMLRIGSRPADAWDPPIVETVATEGRGVAEVWQALERHRAHLNAGGELDRRRRRRIETEVLELVDRRLRETVRQRVEAGGEVAEVLGAACDGRLDPHSAAAAILGGLAPREAAAPGGAAGPRRPAPRLLAGRPTGAPGSLARPEEPPMDDAHHRAAHHAAAGRPDAPRAGRADRPAARPDADHRHQHAHHRDGSA